MGLWSIFVLAQVRLCLNLSYDVLHDLANNHHNMRCLMGVEKGFGYERTEFEYQNIYDNVTLLNDEMVMGLKVVPNLLADARGKGVGQKYMIEHSVGSGKSNSITWLVHQLVGLYNKDTVTPLLDSILVVTDRTNLDEQIRENIKDFAQVKRVVEAITGKAKDIKSIGPNEEGVSKTVHMRLHLPTTRR